MANFLGPRHLGDVNQALYTWFQLNEGTVICEADNASCDFRSSRVILGN